MFGGKSILMTTAVIAGGLVASAAAYAADIKPAVVYDLGGKFDKSFNEGVFNGATKFKKDTGIEFRDLKIQNDAQREQVLRHFAKDGFSPIMTGGFARATGSPGSARSTASRSTPTPSSANCRSACSSASKS